MFRLFKVIGFIFSWIIPFGVIWLNHVVLEDKSWDVDLAGLVLLLALGIGLLKYIDKKVDVWEIQDRHKIFRINWSGGKRIVMAIGLTWLLLTMEDTLPKMQTSALIITLCFVVGFVFTLLGNLKQKKEIQTKASTM